ncbi:topoisomerase 1-associated factor 1 [Nannizzia gypsea CBS 118893]|uniref:Topoisomerase 1-associated factor 1 n=1 Tax=Arthroderma gypseum (strain ATCC MYA-4604 / CBS 118893) TaxID=535722 RepID=E4V2T4_ARTGP|nr:topoisomerase 1-associated factor 1 [Nannizzia gypsea CBS 118893]EFR04308.1 topoisomerase 1-associated factor 1 [Nannizzia gypsea CBS 118893]
MDVEPFVAQPGDQVVDPEVRSFIYGLVTALGGSANDEAGRYMLGDDALGCLRDLKKWLRFYDEKLNRLDVARCIAESNLVNGDLIQILALWDDVKPTDKYKSRISLACLELLVPLTWPVEIHSEMTVNHHRHTPYLQLAQISYKKGILGHASKSILRSIIRIGLPSITTPRAERSSRDEGILKLVLYLFRNVAVLGVTANLAVEGDEDEASRSMTISAFHDQDVFALILTLCSNIGEEFTFQDVILLEILFHLIKGVDVHQLFMDDNQRSATRTDELKGLMDAESNLNRDRSKNAPTRHGRFGTMIWVKRDNEKMSSVSGQDVLLNDQAAFDKMDKTKKWNKPRGKRPVVDETSNNFNVQVHLTSSALNYLRLFVEEFLDSGFNPLMTSIRKAMERESDRLGETSSRHFFFVSSWFLSAERARREQQEEARQNATGSARNIEPDSFALVASVLNQETFIALNRYMQTSLDNKEWQDLNAGMLSFTQTLLTVQEMSKSSLEDDQEIAENILSRIFYEESTHDRILSTLRGYKGQGFWYLDACTELAHVFLRMLEQYSKQNVDMQVRSKRISRRKKKAQNQGQENQEEEDGGFGNSEDEEANDRAEAVRNVAERSFDFKRFCNKFCTQNSVNTFVALTSYYRDLSAEQLKRAHRFFYRVAFKQDVSVLLFRLDIIALFTRMIKGPDGLLSSRPEFREWEELVRQILKKMFRKIDERPELITELLFSKIPATVHYLEYGHEKQTVSVASRPAVELEVKHNYTRTADEKLRIVISVLVADNCEDLVRWLYGVIDNALKDRKSWELADLARGTQDATDMTDITSSTPAIEVSAPGEKHKTAMFKNGHLRLLFTLAGLELAGEDVLGTPWSIPGSISSTELEETRSSIQKHCDDPGTEIDGVDPHKLIHRKRVAGKAMNDEATAQVDFGNDSEGEELGLDEVLFPPNPRSKSKVLKELKQKRRKKAGDDEDNQLDEETLNARRLAREQNALERQRKIKSSLFVNASDDETDDEADQEFFAREAERRKKQAQRVEEAMDIDGFGNNELDNTTKKAKGKRKQAISNDSDDEDENGGHRKRARSEEDEESGGPPGRKAQTPPTSTEDDLIFDMGEKSPAPIFQWTSTAVDRPSKPMATAEHNPDDDDEDDEPVMTTRTRRPKVMAGFVVDSDSE